jgi:hypothetical protein
VQGNDGGIDLGGQEKERRSASRREAGDEAVGTYDSKIGGSVDLSMGHPAVSVQRASKEGRKKIEDERATWCRQRLPSPEAASRMFRGGGTPLNP